MTTRPYAPPAVLAEYVGFSRENPFGLLALSGRICAICTNCLEVVQVDHIDGHRLHMHQHFECRESDHVKKTAVRGPS